METTWISTDYINCGIHIQSNIKQWKSTTVTDIIMDEYQKHYVGQKLLEIKHILCESIYITFKNRHNKSE